MVYAVAKAGNDPKAFQHKNKLWCISTTQCYIAIKTNDLQPNLTV